jgi:hypothetical protein
MLSSKPQSVCATMLLTAQAAYRSVIRTAISTQMPRFTRDIRPSVPAQRAKQRSPGSTPERVPYHSATRVPARESTLAAP